eukprot:5406295-Pleurochrysis_carterae.AAC.2
MNNRPRRTSKSLRGAILRYKAPRSRVPLSKSRVGYCTEATLRVCHQSPAATAKTRLRAC